MQQQLGDVPPINQPLPLPPALPDAASLTPLPQLRSTATHMLPLQSMPPQFVQFLHSAVQYWRMVKLSHSRIERTAFGDMLQPITDAAEAIIAALRGAALSGATAGCKTAGISFLCAAVDWCRLQVQAQ